MQLPATLSPEAFTPIKQFIYLFALIIIVQAIHMVEHVAQVCRSSCSTLPRHMD
jgi:hypothetical protein